LAEKEAKEKNAPICTTHKHEKSRLKKGFPQETQHDKLSALAVLRIKSVFVLQPMFKHPGSKLGFIKRRFFFLKSLILFTAFFLFSTAGSLPAAAPPVLDNWHHKADTSPDAPLRAGVRLSGAAVTYSSPVIAEIDGVPQNGLETAVSGGDGILYVYRADGTLLWSAALPNARCPETGSSKAVSSPAVGPILGNGIPYVVATYGGLRRSGCDGGVAVFRGSDGAKLWSFSLRRFSRREKFWSFSYNVVSSPALADTDGDGKMEIGFGALDRNIYLLNGSGSLRWYYNAADTVFSSPAFADVDSDGRLEMLIGSDITANARLRPPTKNGGFLYAFRTTPRKPKRITFQDSSSYVWRTAFDQVIQSSPLIADVLPSNPGAEVIVGSGCFFPERTSQKKGAWVKILKLTDGKVLRTLPMPACSSASPAAGDLDGDGALEVVSIANGHTSIGGVGSSRVIAWKPSNAETLWSVVPRAGGSNDPFGADFKSVVIADLDGNGSLEVIVANGTNIDILQGHDGAALTCQERRCAEGAYLFRTDRVLNSTPAIADVNGDGRLDLVIGGGRAHYGVLYAWSHFSTFLGSSPGTMAPNAAPWPMFRGNAAHNGVY